MATEQKRSLAEILTEDLLLEEWQVEERSGATLTPELIENYIEVDCLVHDDWLSAAVSSAAVPLPCCVPTFSREMTHWMLQPSCATEPQLPWRRIHACVIRKCSSDEATSAHVQRYLVPRYDFSNSSIHTFLTNVSQESMLASWRNVSEQLDNQLNAPSLNPMSSSLTSEFMNQIMLEVYDKKIRPINGMISNPSVAPTATDSNITSSLKSTSPTSPDPTVDATLCGKATLSPLIAVLESERAYYLLYNYHRFTLFDCLIHSPSILDSSTNRPLFILYQILNMVSYCHSKGLTLGDINLKNIYIDGRLWVQYYLPPSAIVAQGRINKEGGDRSFTATPTHTPTPEDLPLSGFVPSDKNLLTGAGYAPPSLSLSEAVMKWQKGSMTNFDYIMTLNYHAGRRLGDPNNHPIFPWVTDFSHKNGTIRDFNYSKYRLAKGDRQLDFTYQSAFEEARRSSPFSGVIVPHHIGDISSDVTYYVYCARRTPKEVLCDRVRPRWVPEEYPSSIGKLYDWTPDECIPEFFTDPSIFYSIHSDLPDLAVPDWCGSPEELVSAHRHLLESDAVSSELHNWFDLVFGYKLTGEAAVKSKNVYLSLVDDHTLLSSNGIVQLFRSSHPKRAQSTSAPLVVYQWQHYLNMTSLMSLTSFDIGQSRPPQATPSNPEEENREKTLRSFLTERKSSFVHRKTNCSLLDDGSFEHVGYPLANELTFQNEEEPFDVGMFSQTFKDTPSTKVLESSAAADNKQSLLRGILRHRRPVVAETAESFDWQSTNISVLQDTPPLQPLLQIEELSHFLAKSCRDFGTLSLQQWELNDLLILQEDKEESIPDKILRLLGNNESGCSVSFEERAMLDLAAVACIAVELTCNKYLRATLPLDSSLSCRYKILRELLNNGQIHTPYHLTNLIDQVFKPDSSSLIPNVIPTLSASSLIQQFVPLVSFPKYFELLYQTLSEFENRSKLVGLATPPLKPKHSTSDKSKEETGEVDLSIVMSYIACQLDAILPQLDEDGLHLFMLYVFPLFEHPSTCFEAIFVLFDTLSEYLGKRWIQKVMIPSFLYAFDTFEKPSNRCRILSRNMAEKLIEKFSLSIFLSRFLACIIDAVIEPLAKKAPNKKVTQNPSDFLSSTREDGKRRKSSLSRLATSTMSPTRTTVSSKLSLSFNWENQRYRSDDEGEDSDPEADLSFPEASILASRVAASVFGALTDMETAGGPLVEREETLSSTPAKPDLGVGYVISPGVPPALGGTPGGMVPSNESSATAVESIPRKDVESDNNDKGVTDSQLDSSLVEGPGLLLEEEDPLLPSSSDSRPEAFSTPPTFLSNESFEEKECDIEEEAKNETMPTDPQQLAISANISEIASDCIIWLIWRLGPILATKHIAHPLLDSIHRCFSGVCQATDNSSAKQVLNILSSMIEYYSDEVILNLYIPFIKKQVAFLSKKTLLSLKAEANVAASVALLEMSVNKTNNHELLLSFMEDIVHNYFIPLFQLLSSKILPFPSGVKARVTICHSAVELLKVTCTKLGRVRSSEVLLDALQCFFNCFSTAHNKEKSSTAILTPVEGYYNEGNSERCAENTKSPDNENPIAVEEVTATFSPDIVHRAYVDFCKLIGQISLTNYLHNIDVIEELHASYSQEKEADPLGKVPTLLGLTENNSSDSGSDSEDSAIPNSNRGVAYQLGPEVALQGRRGLGPDSTSFGHSSWLVDEVDFGRPPHVDKTLPQAPGGIVSALRQTLSVSTSPLQFRGETGSGQMGGVVDVAAAGGHPRGSALFDAKFGIVSSPGHDGGNDSFVDYNPPFDGKLKGAWHLLWRSRVDHGPNAYEIFDKFHGLKLQSYVGHKSSIRSVHVLDGEHLFLSGSKDRTVKIWSLHNQGDGTAQCNCKQNYLGHQRTVTNVGTISSHQAVSCDGTVHLWDIETSYCIHQFTSPRISQFYSMEVLKESPHILVVSTADSYIRFIDTRMKTLQHLWKTHFQTGGYIRYLAPSTTWIALGNHNGTLNLIDIKTGQLLNHWKPADKWPFQPSTWGENLLQLKVTERGNILTSVGAGIISLWKPNGKVLNHFRGQTSNTQCLETYREELVSISNNGQVFIHGSYEFVRDNVISSTKIKPKEIKGNITCSAALQQNQLLVLGSETGQLVLMT